MRTSGSTVYTQIYGDVGAGSPGVWSPGASSSLPTVEQQHRARRFSHKVHELCESYASCIQKQ
ncbi:unnamed protein product, partial [Callosobruchus maculatus]